MNTRSNGGYAPAALAAIRASLAVLVALTGIALLAPPAAAEHDPNSTYTCLEATNVGLTSATLHAQTTDRSFTSATFTVSGADFTVMPVPPGEPVPGQVESPPLVRYLLDLTDLTPGTTYSYTVVFNPGERAHSDEPCTFTTLHGDLPPVPAYSCLEATNVTDTTATLNAGTTDPSVTSATYSLIIELDAIAVQMPVPAPYSLDLTNLTPGTTYGYAVEFNPGEHGQSNEVCDFTTSGVAPPPGPYVCLAATNVTGTSATLNAGTTDRRVTSATFTLAVSDTVQTFMPVTTPYLFALDLTGLTPGTTYRYTVVFNPGGQAQSNETCTFTTLGNPPGNPPASPQPNPPANPPANPPRLPDTGFEPATGATAGLLLLTIGAVAAAAGRRRKPIFE